MVRSENTVPAPAVRRLSLYLRQLEAFQSNNLQTVSSKQLGQALSLSDAQVRKDLAYFGQFGHPGVGYRVAELIERLRQILGTDRKTTAMLVGLGNLGHALMQYHGFNKKNFEIVAAFDKDPAKFGQAVPDRPAMIIQPMTEMLETVSRLGIKLGLICVPASVAQDVADMMIAAGVRGILNFAPISLKVGPDVAMSSVDLAVQLEQLAFQLSAMQNRPTEETD